MSKINYLNYDDVREDRKRQKRIKKKKTLLRMLYGLQKVNYYLDIS